MGSIEKYLIDYKMEDKVDIREGLAQHFIPYRSDLLIANIHYDVMKRLMEKEAFLKKEWYLFSGLMRTQAGDMKHLLTAKGLEVQREWNHEMTWYTLLAKKAG